MNFRREALWLMLLTLGLPIAAMVFALVLPWLARSW